MSEVKEEKFALYLNIIWKEIQRMIRESYFPIIIKN